jgi:phosphoglycolate phosphatase-like HAD superfamily hydrolase
MACALVAGAREFLQHHAARRPLYVASGTPEPELRHIVRTRGLERYFAGVYGSPRSKRDLLEHIALELEASAASLLFIGDAAQDSDAASALGMPFVGRLAPGQPNPFAEPPLLTVTDLRELQNRWAEVNASFH